MAAVEIRKIPEPAYVSSKDSFGGKMKDYRQIRGLSRRELSLHVGLDHTTIGRIESDQRLPYYHTANTIMRGLRLDEQQKKDALTALDRPYKPKALRVSPRK